MPQVTTRPLYSTAAKPRALGVMLLTSHSALGLSIGGGACPGNTKNVEKPRSEAQVSVAWAFHIKLHQEYITRHLVGLIWAWSPSLVKEPTFR